MSHFAAVPLPHETRNQERYDTPECQIALLSPDFPSIQAREGLKAPQNALKPLQNTTVLAKTTWILVRTCVTLLYSLLLLRRSSSNQDHLVVWYCM